MSKQKNLKTGAILSYISMASAIITSLITSPIINHTFEKTEVGLFGTIGSFVGYMSVFNFGLMNAVIRYVAKYQREDKHKEQENFLGMCFVFYLVIAATVLVVGGICYFNFSQIFYKISEDYIEKGSQMFLLLALNLTFSLATQIFPGVMSAYQRFNFLRTVEIIKSLLRPLLVVFLLSIREDLLTITAIDTALNVLYILSLIAYSMFGLKIKIKLRSIDFSMFRELFSYSIFVFIGAVVDQLYWQIDSTLLPIVLGNEGLRQSAILSNTRALSSYFIKFSLAISSLMLPRVTGMVLDNDSPSKLTNFMIRIGRIQLYVLSLILIAFTLIGQQFVMIQTPPGYEMIYPIGLMLMIVLLIPEIQTIGISILYAKKKHKFRSLTYLAIAILNVILSIPLIKLFNSFGGSFGGALGASISTALALIVGQCITMNIYYKKAIGLEIGRFFRETFHRIWIGNVITLVLGLSVLLIPHGADLTKKEHILFFCIRGLIITVIFVVVQWFVGMNTYEKDLALSAVRKVGILSRFVVKKQGVR